MGTDSSQGKSYMQFYRMGIELSQNFAKSDSSHWEETFSDYDSAKWRV